MDLTNVSRWSVKPRMQVMIKDEAIDSDWLGRCLPIFAFRKEHWQSQWHTKQNKSKHKSECAFARSIQT
jgi:hypothetical protein